MASEKKNHQRTEVVILLNESARINTVFISGIIGLLDKPIANTLAQISNCFCEEVFFLCLQKRIINEKQLKDDIELLGGKLESFFSQEITCIITDETCYSVVKDSSIDAISNTTSNVNLGIGKPLCESSKELKTMTSAGTCNSLFTKARSRNMVMAMPKGRKTSPKSSTLNMFSNAKLWGQAIWKVDHFQNFLKQAVNYIKRQTKVKSKLKTSSSKSRILNEKSKVVFLQKYFIKVENSKRNKCPIYKNLSHYPNIEITLSTRNGSPFNDSHVFKKKLKSVKNNKLTCNSTELSTDRFSISNKIANNGFNKKRSLGKHRYYCQCCNTNFSSYERHTKGPRHQAYIKKKENFQCIFDVLNEYEIKSALDEIHHTSNRDKLEESSSSNGDLSSDESIPFLSDKSSLRRFCKVLSSLGSDTCIPPLNYLNPSNLNCVKISNNFKDFTHMSGLGLKDTQISINSNICPIESEQVLQACNETDSNITNDIRYGTKNEIDETIINVCALDQRNGVTNSTDNKCNFDNGIVTDKCNFYNFEAPSVNNDVEQTRNEIQSETMNIRHLEFENYFHDTCTNGSPSLLSNETENIPFNNPNELQQQTSENPNGTLNLHISQIELTNSTAHVNAYDKPLKVLSENLNTIESSHHQVHYDCDSRNVFGFNNDSAEITHQTQMDSFNSESSDDYELRKNVTEAMNLVVETNNLNNETNDIALDLTVFSKFNL